MPKEVHFFLSVPDNVFFQKKYLKVVIYLIWLHLCLSCLLFGWFYFCFFVCFFNFLFGFFACLLFSFLVFFIVCLFHQSWHCSIVLLYNSLYFIFVTLLLKSQNKKILVVVQLFTIYVRSTTESVVIALVGLNLLSMFIMTKECVKCSVKLSNSSCYFRVAIFFSGHNLQQSKVEVSAQQSSSSVQYIKV